MYKWKIRYSFRGVQFISWDLLCGVYRDHLRGDRLCGVYRDQIRGMLHTAEIPLWSNILAKSKAEFENTLSCLSVAQMGSNNEILKLKKSRDTLPLREYPHIILGGNGLFCSLLSLMCLYNPPPSLCAKIIADLILLFIVISFKIYLSRISNSFMSQLCKKASREERGRGVYKSC